MVSVTATGSSAALSSPSAASSAFGCPGLFLLLLLRRILLAGVLRQSGLKPAEDHEEGDQERAS